MGVKGLESYIERYCPEAVQSISIKALVNEHKRRFGIQNPVLVIDAKCLMRKLYSEDLEWFYGGQWRQFMSKIESFIGEFHKIGVKIVFFFDGAVPPSKDKEWIRRRLDKYFENVKIFSNIQSSATKPCDKSDVPTEISECSIHTLKKLGAEMYQTDRDADVVIAHYAEKNDDVFGILAQDTDFIIFNTKKYLSIKHLNFFRMETKFYDRFKFAFSYLGLNVRQLPLFACLAGNDSISKDLLSNLHEKFRKGEKVYLSTIARDIASLIKAKKWLGDYNNKTELEKISTEIFGDVIHTSMLKDALLFYDLSSAEISLYDSSFLSPRVKELAYKKHIECGNNSDVYNLLVKQEYRSSGLLEDPSRRPAFLVYREIRQRCYSVLLRDRPICNNIPGHNQSILIKEWSVHSRNMTEEPELISPLPLKIHREDLESITSIESVWFEFSEEDKMLLFHAILEAPIDFKIFLRLPKHQIVPICIVNYLIGDGDYSSQLEPLEVAVFVAQFLLCRSEEFKSPRVDNLDARAVHLATLFMKGTSTINLVMGTCGNPASLEINTWDFFDGRLFHYIYYKSKQNSNIANLCSNKVEIYDEFHKLLNNAVNGTIYEYSVFNWNRILKDFNIIRCM